MVISETSGKKSDAVDVDNGFTPRDISYTG